MRLLILPALLMCSVAGCAAPRGVDLAAMDGWDIVVAPDSLPSEQYAAEQFQTFFAQATGKRLPIVNEAKGRARHVFIGPGEAMRKSRCGFDTDEFGPEDLRYVARDDVIVIAGGRPRGTLYGVYCFLEDRMGVRFLTADHTHVPRIEGARVIGPASRFYHPPLEFRYPYYGENHKDHAFAARRRVNTVSGEEKLGGRARQRLINHSFSRYVSLRTHGKEHPEYFSLIGGKRRVDVDHDWSWHGTQLCLTNPDVLRLTVEGVLRDLEKHPDWRNISVSQNDNDHYCRCPLCSALDEQEDSHMGALLTFVNAVAAKVAEKHPDVYVGTLSYWYSRKPPKMMKPRPNVQIQLCSIECCLIHPINDPNCPLNVRFCRDMKDWGEICDNIYVWNYNTNFSNYLLPCPNLRVIEPNVRYFVANGAKGLFMQAAGNAMGAELSDLRNYIISGLIWDPTRSGQALMDEFLDLHYGRAAPPIRRFINLVHDRAEASGLHRNCYGWAVSYGLDREVAQAGLNAFDEAMKLAETDQVRARVEKASVCAYRLAIEPAALLAYRVPVEELKARVTPEVVAQMRPLLRRFFEVCDRHGVTMANEGMKLGDFRKRLREVFGVKEGEDF